MASINKKSVHNIKSKSLSDTRLAGGMGQLAAKQSPVNDLKRSVMSCLLWEDIAYESGSDVADSIAKLVPQVDANVVADIAIEARFSQKLRHVPLYLVNLMAGLESHKHVVASTLEKIIHRPDELCEFVSIYWKNKKQPLSSQIKLGLARAFTKFDEYQLAKWDKKGKEVSLSDVMKLVHPKPINQEQSDLWKRLLNKDLAVPQTWEVGLSASKSIEDKRKVWVDLIESNKIPALALLKNLRNMIDVSVPRDLIVRALDNANPAMLLPVNFYAARTYAPDYTRQIENLMFRCASQYPKLSGWTIMVIDVSGSMGAPLSSNSTFSRMDAGAAMAVLASEMCENIVIYATSGNDMSRVHKTDKVKNCRGFALHDEILESRKTLGMGGIFTKQCIDYIRSVEKEKPDRIIVFSDSQDCDLGNSTLPRPFGKYNYIVDISSNKHGINYKGVWTAEISGWSENFLKYIASYEKLPAVQF